MYAWASENDVIKENQAGFRKGYSTVDNMFILNTLINKYISKSRGRLYCLFVDFQKAFDRVWREGLNYKLIKFGVAGKVYNVLQSMYESVKSCVQVNCSGDATEYFDCLEGVRQGCQLSPFLFNLFLNDLDNELRKTRGSAVNVGLLNLYSLLFADDLIIFAETANMMQKLICNFESYCRKWKLKVNMKKTKIVVFRNGGYLRRYERWTLDGQNVEVVPNYCYLGIYFSTKRRWTTAQKNLAVKGEKALFLLKRYMYRFIDTPVKLWLKIFDSKILPILMYGCEIWGFHEGPDIEGVHNKFCKFLLGLRQTTSNVAVRGELGRMSMKVYRLIRIIKYWLKIVKQADTRYVKTCYYLQFQMAEQNKASWGLDVKNLLFATGFGVVWISQGVENEVLFINEFRQRCFDIEQQNWQTEVASQSSLDVYALIKNTLSMENYVICLEDQRGIQELARFRCAQFPLMMTEGRHLGLEREDRICPCCDLNKLESEQHFLLECPLYADIRQQFISRAENTTVDFINLMSTQNISSMRFLYKFLMKAGNRRKSFLAIDM